MVFKVFLDTNIFAYGQFEDSNSNIILELATKGKINIIVSNLPITEVNAFENRILPTTRFSLEVYR